MSGRGKVLGHIGRGLYWKQSNQVANSDAAIWSASVTSGGLLHCTKDSPVLNAS